MGNREGNCGASRSAGTAVNQAARAVQLINAERELEHRPASHGLMERTRSGPEPAGLTDCRLHLPSQPPLSRADRLIEQAPVGLPQYQDIDVADRPTPALPAMTRGPGPVNVDFVDAADVSESLREHGGNAECPCQ
jgi:hypothetical protein